MASIHDVICSSSTSGHHTNTTEITAKVRRSRKRKRRILFKTTKSIEAKASRLREQTQMRSILFKKMRKQTRKCRDHANTEIGRLQKSTPNGRDHPNISEEFRST